MTCDVFLVQTLADAILLEALVQLRIGYTILDSTPHAVERKFVLIMNAYLVPRHCEESDRFQKLQLRAVRCEEPPLPRETVFPPLKVRQTDKSSVFQERNR